MQRRGWRRAVGRARVGQTERSRLRPLPARQGSMEGWAEFIQEMQSFYQAGGDGWRGVGRTALTAWTA